MKLSASYVVSPPLFLHSGYPLAKSHAPVPVITVDEEVSKPVQEAGNDTNFEMDPECGLIESSLVQA